MGELKWSLQALACEAEVQLSLYPDFVSKVEELANDFDGFRMAAIDNFGSEFSNASLNLLEAIDRKLDEIGEELWTPNGLRNDPNWQDIRMMARDALDSFGWPFENPDPNDSTVYIPVK